MTPLKPGGGNMQPSPAARDEAVFFGIKPVRYLTDNGVRELTGSDVEGCFVYADSWPGQMRTIFGAIMNGSSRPIQRLPKAILSRRWVSAPDADGVLWIHPAA